MRARRRNASSSNPSWLESAGAALLARAAARSCQHAPGGPKLPPRDDGPRPRALRARRRAERLWNRAIAKHRRKAKRSGERGRVVQRARHGPSAWRADGREARRRSEAPELGVSRGFPCHAVDPCNMQVRREEQARYRSMNRGCPAAYQVEASMRERACQDWHSCRAPDGYTHQPRSSQHILRQLAISSLDEE